MTSTSTVKKRSILGVVLAIALAGSIGVLGGASMAFADEGEAPMAAQAQSYIYFDIAYEGGTPNAYGSVYATANGQAVSSGAALENGTPVHIVYTAPAGWSFNQGTTVEYDAIVGQGQNFTFAAHPIATYSVSGSMANGSVSGSQSGLMPGSTVTLTFVPNAGYQITNPGAYGLTDNGNGTYSYTAYDVYSDVNVYAEATAIPAVVDDTPAVEPQAGPTPDPSSSTPAADNNTPAPADNNGASGDNGSQEQQAPAQQDATPVDNGSGNGGYTPANNGNADYAAPAAAAAGAATQAAQGEGAGDGEAAAEGDADDAADSADGADKADGKEAIDDDATPKAEGIDDDANPLAAGITAVSWSLFNVLATIVTLVLAVFLMLGLRRKDSERKTLRFSSLLPAIVALVAFILTQTFSGSMAFFDQWSAVFAVVLVAQVVITALAMRKAGASTTAAA